MQEGSGQDKGSQGGGEECLSDWPFVRQYAAMSGGVSERIGTEARHEAARGEYTSDAMARLRQGLISLEDFRLFMQSRGSDELAQVRLPPSPDAPKRPARHIPRLALRFGDPGTAWNTGSTGVRCVRTHAGRSQRRYCINEFGTACVPR